MSPYIQHVSRPQLVCTLIFVPLKVSSKQKSQGLVVIVIATHEWRKTQGFLPQLHEYYFATGGNKIVENCRCIVPNLIND